MLLACGMDSSINTGRVSHVPGSGRISVPMDSFLGNCGKRFRNASGLTMRNR